MSQCVPSHVQFVSLCVVHSVRIISLPVAWIQQTSYLANLFHKESFFRCLSHFLWTKSQIHLLGRLLPAHYRQVSYTHRTVPVPLAAWMSSSVHMCRCTKQITATVCRCGFEGSRSEVHTENFSQHLWIEGILLNTQFMRRSQTFATRSPLCVFRFVGLFFSIFLISAKSHYVTTLISS